jgi:hypothetical protein
MISSMTSEADIIKMLHIEAADLLRNKKQDEEIISYIVAKGYERRYAETILDNIKEDAEDKINFRKTLLYGLGLLLSGVLVSFTSYSFARSMGALFYFFYWGLIVTGISIIARAFIIFKK